MSKAAANKTKAQNATAAPSGASEGDNTPSSVAETAQPAAPAVASKKPQVKLTNNSKNAMRLLGDLVIPAGGSAIINVDEYKEHKYVKQLIDLGILTQAKA